MFNDFYQSASKFNLKGKGARVAHVTKTLSGKKVLIRLDKKNNIVLSADGTYLILSKKELLDCSFMKTKKVYGVRVFKSVDGCTGWCFCADGYTLFETTSLEEANQRKLEFEVEFKGKAQYAVGVMRVENGE